MIFIAPVLDDAEKRVVEKIEQVKTNLGYAVQVPERWTGLLRRNALGRAIRGSNSIEGYHVTVEDAIAAADGEEPLDADSDSWKAVTGYRTAMTYVMQLADDPHFTYSDALIKSLHFMMMQHDLGRHPGKWRPGPIFVYDEDRHEQVYEGPEDTLVVPLVTELVGTLNHDADLTPAVVQAAMAHLNLAMIHPFSDGNGRMARCLQTLVLARSGTLAPAFSSIEEHLGRNHRAYYDVLTQVGNGRWHPENDARPWVRFCLKAHFMQASTILRRSRELARLWDALERIVGDRGLPDRMLLALADAALGLSVRNATYRTAAEITDNLAGRDLKTLADAGLLIAQGERRGRRYVAAQAILDTRTRTSEEGRISDPFEEDVGS